MTKRNRKWFACSAVLAVLALPAFAQSITVFAASSLTSVLEPIAAAFEKETGIHVTANTAASSMLAKQMEQGSPADLFISADTDWMDYVEERNLIQSDSRKNLLYNKLVIIAPADRSTSIEVKPEFRFASAFQGRLAIGDPDSVPAGKYAKKSLTNLGWWNSVKDRLAPAENVRAALKLVELGEVDLGIVFATDAAASHKVRVVAEIPESLHGPIVYPAALCKGAGDPAREFMKYLQSPAAVELFHQAGFGIVE